MPICELTWQAGHDNSSLCLDTSVLLPWYGRRSVSKARYLSGCPEKIFQETTQDLMGAIYSHRVGVPAEVWCTREVWAEYSRVWEQLSDAVYKCEGKRVPVQPLLHAWNHVELTRFALAPLQHSPTRLDDLCTRLAIALSRRVDLEEHNKKRVRNTDEKVIGSAFARSLSSHKGVYLVTGDYRQAVLACSVQNFLLGRFATKGCGQLASAAELCPVRPFLVRNGKPSELFENDFDYLYIDGLRKLVGQIADLAEAPHSRTA